MQQNRSSEQKSWSAFPGSWRVLPSMPVLTAQAPQGPGTRMTLKLSLATASLTQLLSPQDLTALILFGLVLSLIWKPHGQAPYEPPLYCPQLPIPYLTGSAERDRA